MVVISLWLLGSWGKAGGKKKDAVRKGNGKKKDAVGKGETETKGALSWIFFRNPRIQQWKQRLWPWKGKGKETPGNNTENRKKPADPERGPE